MLRTGLTALALAVAAPLASAASAEPWRWPAISGEVTGDFTLVAGPGTPVVHWVLTAQPDAADGRREFALAARGLGLELAGTVRVAADGAFDWRVDRLELDLAPWFGAVATRWLPAAGGLTVTGKIHASGEGSVRDGRVAGRAKLAWREGTLDDPARKLSLAGIALDLAFDDLAAGRAPAGQRLTWTSGKFDVVKLGAGRMEFSLLGSALAVQEATLQAFGGDLRATALRLVFGRPEFTVRAGLSGVELAELLPFLPPVVTEARGKLDGTLDLRGTAAGIEVGVGQLAVRAGEHAVLRLAPSPGLLSGSLPASVRKYYPGLGDLEEGRMPLKATIFEVTVSPGGDEAGRTATVRVAGGPADPRLTAPVDLTVNVRGPLEWLVKFGTDSRLHFR